MSFVVQLQRVLGVRCSGRKRIRGQFWLESQPLRRTQDVATVLGIHLIIFPSMGRGKKTARRAVSKACWLSSVCQQCWSTEGLDRAQDFPWRWAQGEQTSGINAFLSRLCSEGHGDLPFFPISLGVPGAEKKKKKANCSGVLPAGGGGNRDLTC